MGRHAAMSSAQLASSEERVRTVLGTPASFTDIAGRGAGRLEVHHTTPVIDRPPARVERPAVQVASSDDDLGSALRCLDDLVRLFAADDRLLDADALLVGLPQRRSDVR